MPSQAQVARIQKQRDSALKSAARARAKEKDAETKLADARKEKRAALRMQARRWALLLLLLALAIVGGLVVGGQLTRIVDPETKGMNKWVSRGQWLAFVAGLLMLVLAKRVWMYVVGFILLGIGGVKISDVSRMADLIPGDQTWENVIPPGKTKIVVVEDAS
jgi:predicted anti-sigma-YlaC factor YlaD